MKAKQSIHIGANAKLELPKNADNSILKNSDESMLIIKESEEELNE